MKVFLGGTYKSKWCDHLKKMLTVDYFDPVVDDWDGEARKRESYERGHCDFCLYVITPKMTGVYAVAEAVDDSNKRPDKTIFCFLKYDEGKSFTDGQIRSLQAVSEMIKRNGGRVFDDLYDVAMFLNSFGKERAEL